MEKITGTGCQISGIATAFAVANPDATLEAVTAAIALMGVAGDIAWDALQPGEGNASYRNRIIDAIYTLDAQHLDGDDAVQAGVVPQVHLGHAAPPDEGAHLVASA